jgi:uncharacterized membrane protein
MPNEIPRSAVMATAIAALFATLPAAADQPAQHKDDAKVKCAGINECKGKSACHGNGNACVGQNTCKGKGWIEVQSEKECKDKGGKVLK